LIDIQDEFNINTSNRSISRFTRWSHSTSSLGSSYREWICKENYFLMTFLIELLMFVLFLEKRKWKNACTSYRKCQ